MINNYKIVDQYIGISLKLLTHETTLFPMYYFLITLAYVACIHIYINKITWGLMCTDVQKCAKMSSAHITPKYTRNTLCRHEMDPGHGGTPSTDRKSTRDMAEQTLPTGNRPGTRRNSLCRPDTLPEPPHGRAISRLNRLGKKN